VIGKVVHAVAGGHPLPSGYRKVVRVSGQPFPDSLQAPIATER
jgi:hypothetical protein